MLIIPTLLCPKPWETMSGDEAQRFCTYCKKYVHNLSALTVSERLALLTSPAASVCSRYKVAVRRPIKGKEKSYFRHLIKYGAGVALTGSVLLVLWEMHGRAEQEKFYRTAPLGGRFHCAMPNDLFEEHEIITVGMIAVPPASEAADKINPLESESSPPHIDLKLDPVEINRLIDQSIQRAPIQSPPNRAGDTNYKV